MKVDKLEALILNDMSDNYQRLAWLHEDRSLEMGFPVDEQMVIDAVRKLSVSGLVDVMRYDVANQRYVATPLDGTVATSDLWFYITDKGREALDESWRDEWLKE